MINTYIEELQEGNSPLAKALLNKDVVVMDMIGKSLSYTLYNHVGNYILAHDLNKESLKSFIQTILKAEIKNDELNELLVETQSINRLSSNPFELSGLVGQGSRQVLKAMDLNVNTMSIYHDKLTPKKSTSTVDLLLKSIRINDSIKFDGITLIEIIVAFQAFHNKKVMATPIVYSPDRGVGKTLLVSVGGYLYENSPYSLINMGQGANATQWGDPFLDKRVAIYDDIPDDEETVKLLTSSVKSYATQGGNVAINPKGKGIISTNAWNQAGTTNFLKSIILDDGAKDRRIHPVHVKQSDYTREEKREIDNLSLPMIGDTETYSQPIQDLLNYLLWVYERFKNNKEVLSALFVAVPLSDFKKEVARGKLGVYARFLEVLSGAKDKTDLYNTLSDEYQHDFSGNFEDEKQALYYEVKGTTFLILKAEGLVSLGNMFLGGGVKASEVARRLFKGALVKNYTVNGKTVRGVRVELTNFEEKALDKGYIIPTVYKEKEVEVDFFDDSKYPFPVIFEDSVKSVRTHRQRE